ncbi:kynurenine 3-monooxygenase-like [Mytilus galloprovincialis]|uniref:kynurenine 3-monooxygenase-like n=1 Tax=Mytilus galloprovincialis TaxID=29158 RepID=UPI003F7B7E64
MSGEKQVKHVAVVGGGLVGSLNACFFAKRKYKVDLYEMRDDIRTMEIVKGRSINLALSCRGREALKHVGLEDEVLKTAIPMHARMIHDLDGTCHPIPYGKSDQFINSVDRRLLNEVLLTAAERNPQVTCHFNHKLLKCDFNTGELTFLTKEGKEVKNKVDLIVGNDGAFSAIRRQMMKDTLLDYNQEYIPHGYMELTIPPTLSNDFAMGVNYLHIWPRNEFMMIALPNLDKSYTLTLFMPFENFNQIKNEDDVMDFFQRMFPDSIPLIGEKFLKEIYKSSKALPMVSIKCSPYHVKDKVVIMGDAAHAMVPFYGQGMNCGFEDCIVLNDMLDKHSDNLELALKAYTEHRNPDAKAIVDLAMYNYVEMRKSVNSKMFLLRKKIDNMLHWIFPNSWVPLYTMVSFSRERYHLCIAKRQQQDKVLSTFIQVGVVSLMVGGFLLVRRLNQTTDIMTPLQGRIQSLLDRLHL